MNIQTFAKLFGVAFLLIGILGFIPGMTMPHVHPGMEDVAVKQGLGELMGLFPVNVLHNLFHVAFGIWGLAASRSSGASSIYAKGVALIYAALSIFGLIPAAKLWTTFGLIPLYGNDVWLHIVLAAIAAYFGFARHRTGSDI